LHETRVGAQRCFGGLDTSVMEGLASDVTEPSHETWDCSPATRWPDGLVRDVHATCDKLLTEPRLENCSPRAEEERQKDLEKVLGMSAERCMARVNVRAPRSARA
jgi:hypothetical protein